MKAMDWIELSQGGAQWQNIVNVVFPSSIKAGNFFGEVFMTR